MSEAVDIFDVGDLGSVVRKLVKEEARIDLAEFDVSTYTIPDDYTVTSRTFESETYRKEIRAWIEPIIAEAEERGHPQNLFTALYEAVLNAYHHGNERDPEKTVTLAYKITDQAVELSVMDEGGILDPEFLSFVLWHREGRHKEKVVSFYDFANKKRNDENLGTGTTFMHQYANVSYFKGENGGLVVHMRAQKPE
ncbi:ATP-binding protein [Nanoarchaeota archaeon]